jgi:hypothetical protein
VASDDKEVKLARLLLKQRNSPRLDQHHLYAEARRPEFAFSICDLPRQLPMPIVADLVHRHARADNGAGSDKGLFGGEKADRYAVAGQSLRPGQCRTRLARAVEGAPAQSRPVLALGVAARCDRHRARCARE